MKTNENLQKFVTTSTDAAFAAQMGVEVQGITTLQTPKNCLAKEIPSYNNGGLAAVWTVLDSVIYADASGNPDPTASFCFTEGECPDDLKLNKRQKSAIKKHFGVQYKISNHALAGSSQACSALSWENKLRDEKALALQRAYTTYENELDNMLVNGDATSSPLCFDGLYKQIIFDTLATPLGPDASVILDANGANLTLQMLYNVITLLMMRGAVPTHIVTSPMMVTYLQQLVQLTGGCCGQYNPFIPTIPTAAGSLPMCPNLHVLNRFQEDVDGNPQITWGFNSDIFIITREQDGEDILYMDYTINPSAIDTSKVVGCTSQAMAVYGTGVFVNRAPSLQGAIYNAGFCADTSMTTAITAAPAL